MKHYVMCALLIVYCREAVLICEIIGHFSRRIRGKILSNWSVWFIPFITVLKNIFIYTETSFRISIYLLDLSIRLILANLASSLNLGCPRIRLFSIFSTMHQ